MAPPPNIMETSSKRPSSRKSSAIMPSGSAPVIAMAAAARTKRIRVGTGVSLIPLNHPVRLAEEYAMLDVLSEGRLEYGIGRGFLNYSYQIFGVNPDESHARYREGTDLIVRAW